MTTAVTCPTMRIHPAIVAQAAATASLMLEGQFRLGVGTGENLNEHILGDQWPPTDVRLEMLEEAIEVLRRLWTGAWVSHHGAHYTVEDARLYSCPTGPCPSTSQDWVQSPPGWPPGWARATSTPAPARRACSAIASMAARGRARRP